MEITPFRAPRLIINSRWAAKEAVIKAHRHRQLYMQDVSIVRLPRQLSRDNKAVALVDPSCSTVEMNERVAELRGLRGFGPQSQGLSKGTLSAKSEDDETSPGHGKQSAHFNRRRKIKESDRQIAELNISHDGDYAVAVCLTFDSPNLHSEGRRIIDDGEGPPIHEPQWGDDGWFSQDDIPKDEDWKNVLLDDLIENPKPSMDTEAYSKAFKEALEDAEKLEHWKIPPLP